jgi:hypothetical protein
MRQAGVPPNQHVVAALLKAVPNADPGDQDRLLTFVVNETVAHQVDLGDHLMCVACVRVGAVA